MCSHGVAILDEVRDGMLCTPYCYNPYSNSYTVYIHTSIYTCTLRTVMVRYIQYPHRTAV